MPSTYQLILHAMKSHFPGGGHFWPAVGYVTAAVPLVGVITCSHSEARDSLPTGGTELIPMRDLINRRTGSNVLAGKLILPMGRLSTIHLCLLTTKYGQFTTIANLAMICHADFSFQRDSETSIDKLLIPGWREKSAGG